MNSRRFAHPGPYSITAWACAVVSAALRGRAASVHECLIDERLEHLAVIGADRARRLGHVDTDDLFLGVDPEIGAGIARPHELACGAGNTGNAIALAHGKAKAECVAGRSQ